MSNNRQVGYTGDAYSVEGAAELIHDKAEFAKHWVKDLEFFFKDGIDTPSLTLIHVEAHRITYWDGWEEGRISL
ncbi:MAG: pyridoxamine 5'-phosphate oxidase family protein [Rickettsiales bacterium]|nr:pyridoxamine 5'-phosphate oxidase family protein [Rickettsiales bacterium]